jgi:hypothetical protein
MREMRFKATIDTVHFPWFFSHVMLMERIGKRAVLLFASPSCRFLVTSETDTVMQYSTLDTAAVFTSLRCESRTNNVIAVEVGVSNLVHGLKPSGPFEELTMKLTKRDAAQYLRVETRTRDGGAALVQDIPVRVIPGGEMLRYMPPSIPSPKVCILLPAAKVLCSVVDKMKTLGKDLDIEVVAGTSTTPSSRLNLSVGNDVVRVKTYFTGLVCEAGTAPSASCSVSLPDFTRTLKGVKEVGEYKSITVKLALVPPTALYVNVLLAGGVGTISIVHCVKDRGEGGEEEGEGGGEGDGEGGVGGGGGGEGEAELTGDDFY